MIVIVCGDRHWCDRHLIEHRLNQFPPTNTTIIEGEATGADRLGRAVAEMLGITVIAVRADWETYGLAAGPVRNKVMLTALLDSDDPEKLIIAFHDDIGASKGTRNMVDAARTAGVRVDVISHQ